MAEAQKEKIRILLVDDDERNLRILKRSLRGFENIELHEVMDGEAALQTYEGIKPDIIFLDIMMPKLDGYSVCKKIRYKFGDTNVKIILLSGKASLEDKIKGYEVGADDYIAKPFDPPELRAKFHVLANLARAEKELLRINADLNLEIERRTQALFKQEQDAAIGRSAAEIVHNLRNPLSLIVMVSQILLNKKVEPLLAGKLQVAAGQMKDLISSILAQARRESLNETPYCEIEAIIQQVLEVLKLNAVKLGIQIDYENQLLSDLMVSGKKTELNQVFGNILQNAMHALAKSENKKINITLKNESSDAIMIQIQDLGHGIPKENLDKIFDLHFTTKTDKGVNEELGTGIGLAYCKKIVESYQGTISVESEEGKGSTFFITLPIHSKGKSSEEAA